MTVHGLALQRTQNEQVQCSLQQFNAILIFCILGHADVDILLPGTKTVYLHEGKAPSRFNEHVISNERADLLARPVSGKGDQRQKSALHKEQMCPKPGRSPQVSLVTRNKGGPPLIAPFRRLPTHDEVQGSSCLDLLPRDNRNVQWLSVKRRRLNIDILR